ncbi:unnamed protein product [Cunninghamella echinulata]
MDNNFDSNNNNNNITTYQDNEFRIWNRSGISESVAARRRRSLATYNQYVGAHTSHIRPTEDLFNSNNPQMKNDILAIIMQYLSDEGYHTSQAVLHNETNID